MLNLIITNFFFYILFIQTKKSEQTKQNKAVVKIIKAFSLSIGRWNSKSCQFNAARASLILTMLFSSPESDIGRVSKY